MHPLFLDTEGSTLLDGSYWHFLVYLEKSDAWSVALLKAVLCAHILYLHTYP